MADGTKIEWTDASWSPIRARYWQIQDDGSGKERIGWHCEHVSEGCRWCYAERINIRLGTGRDYAPDELYRKEREGYRNGEVKLFLDDKMLAQPLRWRQPRKIFVCSMTDLFADFVPDDWIDRVFAVMALSPQHTFQVLTKRAERMRDYLRTLGLYKRIFEEACNLTQKRENLAYGPQECNWPLPWVWLGVSVEDQQRADERIPLLLDTPAAKRFISAEPLLSAIKLRETLSINGNGDWLASGLSGERKGLDWVIAGGESGPNARSMHPAWARSLRDQCTAAGIAFFHKQNGEFASVSEVEGAGAHHHFPDGATVRRVGKKAAGRLLDGREWSEFPA